MARYLFILAHIPTGASAFYKGAVPHQEGPTIPAATEGLLDNPLYYPTPIQPHQKMRLLLWCKLPFLLSLCFLSFLESYQYSTYPLSQWSGQTNCPSLDSKSRLQFVVLFLVTRCKVGKLLLKAVTEELVDVSSGENIALKWVFMRSQGWLVQKDSRLYNEDYHLIWSVARASP